MRVTEIIKLLDKEENKYGGATGRERELNLSINGDFVGTVTSAKLDGYGDGLVTDVTLDVEVDSIKYHDNKIRNDAIDEFAERCKEDVLCQTFGLHPNGIERIAEQMKGAKNGKS